MKRPLVGVMATHREVEGKFPIQGVGTNNLQAVSEAADAQPLLIPGLPQTQDVPSLLEVFDGILLTGGRPNVHPEFFGEQPTPAHEPFDQNRDAVALELASACVETGVPILGVCRGLQEMAVAYGARLHPEIRDLPGRMNHRMPPDETDLAVIFEDRHDVMLTPGGVFAELYGTDRIFVNSLHGQAIIEPGDRIAVEGVAEDGTIEAISVPSAKGFALGVQWHAEYDAARHPINGQLMRAFGEAVRAHSARRS